MSAYLLSQILAAFAFLFGLASFQFRSRRSILICWFVSASLNATHFFVLEQSAVGFLVAITAIRFLVAAFVLDQRIMFAFLLASFSGFWFLYEDLISLLGLIATLLGTYASFQAKDRRIRLLMMICAVLWAVHNFAVETYVAALMELAFLMSNLIGWRRYQNASPRESTRPAR